MLATLRALKASERVVLREFLCNWNDLENKEIATECITILRDDLSVREDGDRKLKLVELIGTEVLKKAERNQYKQELEDKGVELLFVEKVEGEDEDEDDEDDEDDDDDEGEEAN